jgi:two-component system, response regulator PdtaR
MEQLPRTSSAVALVVDSDMARRRRIAASLRRARFQVYEAADANEAIRLLNSFVVDVLFSDIDLSGETDGIELAAWVRQHHVDTSIVLTHADQRSPARLLH